MKKLIFTKLIKVLIFIVLLYAVGRFVVVFYDSQLTGYRAPYLQLQTQSSVIVRWLTEENQLGAIRFGEDSTNLSNIERETSAVKDHSLQLSKLKPATRYYYQVGTVNGADDDFTKVQWFQTHPEKNPSTRIWVIGDSGKAGEILDQVRESAYAWMQQNPLLVTEVVADSAIIASPADKTITSPVIDVWIVLGDIAYRSGTNEQFQSALFDSFTDLLATSSLWPVYGNHDDRRWTYFRIFDLPENAEAGGVASHTENYYSLDYSNIHFVMLDSQDSDRSATGEMANWLKRDLAQNTQPWVIAAFHHPPYTKGTHNSDDNYDSRGRMAQMRENILPILEAGGVDLVLSGHSHMYERSYLLDCAYEKSDKFSVKNIVSAGVNGQHQQYMKAVQPKAHQGAVYVVAGSAAKIDNGPMDHPAHFTGQLVAGSLVIDVDNNKLSVHFIDNKGQVKDEFSITKQAGYQSAYQAAFQGCE